MQWTIGKKLYTNVAVLGLVIVGIVGAFYYVATTQLAVDLTEVASKTAPDLNRAGTMRYLVATYRAESRHNVVLAAAKDAAGIDENRRQMDGYAEQFAKLSDELAQNAATAEIKDLARDTASQMKAYVAEEAKVTALAAAFRQAEAAQQMAGALTLGDKLEVACEKLEQLQLAELAAVTAEGNGDNRVGNELLSALAVAALLALIVVVVVVRNLIRTLTGTVNTLKSGSEQVTSAATQVSASAQSLSQGSTEQAASLEETSASMEEMASMTRKNAANSQQAAALMQDVDRVVDGSNAALADMTASMASIGESSNKVAKIIKTIDEIAFQTNILALNAAVEAARAGEAGMGFAVVAGEVRNLAQRSAQAAKDTASLIEESIVKSQEGHAKVLVVGQSIAAITESVGKVKGLVMEVSEASQQQAQGIDQVAHAVAQMEKVTQSTAATAEESAAASEELNAQAESTMAEVAKMEAMVVGGRGDAVAPPRPTPVQGTTRRILHRAAVLVATTALLSIGRLSSAQTPTPVPADGGLVPGRPGFTESRGVVPAGAVQIEGGYTFTTDETGGVISHQSNLPGASVRFGLGGVVELRVSGIGITSQSLSSPSSHVHSGGFGDVQAGVKIMVLDERRAPLEVAVIPMISIPSRVDSVSTFGYDPSLTVSFGRALPKGFDATGLVRWASLSLGATSAAQYSTSLSVGHEIANDWDGSAEVFGLSDPMTGATQWNLGLAVARPVGRRTQIDLDLGHSLNSPAPNWTFGVGFVIKAR